MPNCYNCPLAEMCDGVEGQMPTDCYTTDIAFIGESPGRVEISTRKVFTGPSGDLFDKILESAKIDRAECYVGNTTLCVNLGKEHTPTSNMTNACRPRLISTLKRLRPKIVVALGGVSANVLLRSDEKITAIQGSLQWSDELECFILPTFHPASVLRGAVGNFDSIQSAFVRAGKMIRGEVPLPKPHEQIEYSHAKTVEEVSDVLTQIYRMSFKKPTLAIDVESETITDPNYTLLMIQISDGEDTWVLDAKPLLARKRNRYRFGRLLENNRITWVLHNMQFDFQYFMRHFGKVPTNAEDTMAMALCLTEKSDQIGLKKLARDWLNAPYYEAELRQAIDGGKTFSSIPRDVLAKYGAQDVMYTRRLLDVLSPLVDEEDSRFLYEKILIPAQRSFADMQYYGTAVDLEYAEGLHEYWDPIVATAREDIRDFADEWGFDASKVVAKPKDKRLNPKSSKQLSHLLFDIMKYKPPTGGDAMGHRIKTQRTTGGVFRKFYEGEPIVQLLEKFIHTDHMLRNYVDGISDDVWPDGRVHPDFLLYGTVTGRLSVRNPPLQTIPREAAVEGNMGSIKRMFIAPPGYTIVDVDYKQLELRIAWHYAGDEALGEACMSGDAHREIAARIHNKRPEDITGIERYNSKRTTFGLMYGRSAKSMALGADNTIETEAEAQAYMDDYFDRFPGYAEWWHNIREEAVETGILRTALGRTRRWKLITPEMVNHIKNQAVNFPIQSLASDMCLMALNALNRKLRALGWGYVLFTVHDSILFEIKDEFVLEALNLINIEMTRAPFETQAVFEIDATSGPNWGETTEVPASAYT